MPLQKLIIFIGQYFRDYELGNDVDVQNFIANETEQGGIRLPLSEIRFGLQILSIAGFISEIGNGIYGWTHKVIVTEQKVVNVCNFEIANPLYMGQI